MSVRVTIGPGFMAGLKKLPPDRREKAINSLELFQQEPRLGRFKFRRFQGAPGHFVINTARGDRILLRLVESDLYEVVDVGPHDMYRKWNR